MIYITSYFILKLFRIEQGIESVDSISNIFELLELNSKFRILKILKMEIKST